MPEDDYEAKAQQVAVIAKPLATQKLSKKLLKLCRKATKKKQVKRGVKEVVKAVRKNNKGWAAQRILCSSRRSVQHSLCAHCQQHTVAASRVRMLHVPVAVKAAAVLCCLHMLFTTMTGPRGVL